MGAPAHHVATDSAPSFHPAPGAKGDRSPLTERPLSDSSVPRNPLIGLVSGTSIWWRPGMLGLRFTFPPPHQGVWLTDGTVDWRRPAAERASLPLALMAAGFLPKVAGVAQRHPTLKLILDHPGRPSGGTASQPDLWANLPEVVALARYPNVAMKAAGAPTYSGRAYPFPDIHDNLHRLYDAFGPTRFFWARTRAGPSGSSEARTADRLSPSRRR
jgi:hypothetical protein